jgi:putative ABC transport system permease protein
VKGGHLPHLAVARHGAGTDESLHKRTDNSREKALIEAIQSGIHSALRRIIRTPGSSAIAILVLTVSIGVVTAVFGVANSIWLRPLPYPDPLQLTMVWQENPSKGRHENLVSARNFLDWRDQQRGIFDNLAAFRRINCVLSSGDDNGAAAEHVAAAQVSAELFATLRTPPLLGRGFSRQEELQGNDHVVVLGYQLWRRTFQGNPQVLGTTQRVNGQPMVVVGVMPDGFQFPESADLWMPLGLTELDLSVRQMRSLYVVARLHIDQRLPQAQGALTQLYQSTESASAVKAGWTVLLRPLREQAIRNALPALILLVSAATLILLIAAVNIGALMVVRADTQKRMIAMKTALGATRGRMTGELLLETILLSIIGGALSLPLLAAVAAKMGSLAPTGLFRVDVIIFDYRVLAFTILLSIFIGTIAGVFPVLSTTSRRDMMEWLRSGAGQSARPREKHIANGLVISQIGVLTVLLILSALIARSFANLVTVHIGFATDHLLTMVFVPSDNRQHASPPNNGHDAGALLVEQVVERVSKLPGIRSAAAVNALPLSGDYYSTTFRIRGRPEPREKENTAEVRLCTRDYLRTMKIAIIAGRSFEEHDNSARMPVAIINSTLARVFWQGASPIGARIEVDIGDKPSELEVVGIADDVRDLSLNSAAPPEIYVPVAQHSFSGGRLVIRTERDPMLEAPTVIRAIKEAAPQRPVFECQSMEQLLDRITAPQRALTEIMAIFGFLAVLLALMGIYSVTNHVFVQREKEFAIRMAMGATSKAILILALARSFALALVGVTGGLILAALSARALEHFLFGVSGTDPATYLVMAALSVVTSALATLPPGYRISRIEPIRLIRTL